MFASVATFLRPHYKFRPNYNNYVIVRSKGLSNHNYVLSYQHFKRTERKEKATSADLKDFSRSKPV